MTEVFIKKDQEYSQEIKTEIAKTNSLIIDAENIIDHLLSQKQLTSTETYDNKSQNNINILEYLKKINKCSKIIKTNLLIIKKDTNKIIINSKIIEIKKCINNIFNYIHNIKNNINNM
jgi:hypothetical protein